MTALSAIVAAVSADAAPADEYRDEIRPILEKHCYECHGPEKPKGKLNLTTFSEFDKVVEVKEVWQHVRLMLDLIALAF